MTALVRRLVDAWRAWRPRLSTSVKVVGGAYVAGGSVVHVVDVDRRRIVFVTGRHSACLLDRYETPPAPAHASHRNVCTIPSNHQS